MKETGSGGLPAWDRGELPEPPRFGGRQWAGLLGPGILMAGTAIGTGEWLVGPRITAQYGGALMWVATVSLLAQLVFNLEASRYTLATGEPILTGAFRTRPGPGFWLVVYLLMDLGAILPYQLANAATTLAALWRGRIPDPQGVPADQSLVVGLTYAMLVLALLPLLVGGRVYDSLKAILTFKVVVVLGVLLFLAVVYSSAATWREIAAGLVGFGNVPVDERNVANVLGSLWRGEGLPRVDRDSLVWLTSFAAIAGVGGLAQTTVSNYTREQGWGMGAQVGSIPSIVGGKEIELSHTGSVFEVTLESVRRFRRWVRHVLRDQLVVWLPASVVGLALPSMLSVEFLPRGTVANQWVLAGMTAGGVQERIGGALGVSFWYVILFCGFLVLMPNASGNADSFLRRWIDVGWTALGSLRRLDPRRIGALYFSMLVSYFLIALFFLVFVREPRTLIVAYANLGNFALGVACWHTLAVNVRLLPREIRPGWAPRVGLVLAGLWFFALAGATAWVSLSPRAAPSDSGREGYSGRRVFFVSSYHEGYGSSDDVARGLRETLRPAGVVVETAFLDTKRRPEDVDAASARALGRLRAFRPDVVVVSDDAAVRHLVVPHLKDGPVPVVFCGVNWSAEAYGVPNEHVTGMVEVVPILETLETVRRHAPGARRLFVLSEDSLSEEANRVHLDPAYAKAGWDVTWSLVRDYAAWKDAFVRGQGWDVVYLPTNGAVAGWDDADARRFVRKAIRRPVVTCDDFMIPYAVLGLVKVAREQGEWAGDAALAILSGKRPSEIPLASNAQVRALFNAELAARIGFVPDEELRRLLEAAPKGGTP
jgi:ABC-type uncharacterized transport system substrate-binding protein